MPSYTTPQPNVDIQMTFLPSSSTGTIITIDAQTRKAQRVAKGVEFNHYSLSLTKSSQPVIHHHHPQVNINCGRSEENEKDRRNKPTKRAKNIESLNVTTDITDICKIFIIVVVIPEMS